MQRSGFILGALALAGCGGGGGGSSTLPNSPSPSSAPNAVSAMTAATLQSTIANAPAGSTITIPAGTYIVSGLAIAKNLSLVGAGIGKTILKLAPGSAQNVLQILSGQSSGQVAWPLTISGISFDASGGAPPNLTTGDSLQNGLYIERVNGFTIADCEFFGASFHGLAFNACQATISNLNCHGNNYDGACFTGSTIYTASISGSMTSSGNTLISKSGDPVNGDLVDAGSGLIETVSAGVYLGFQTNANLQLASSGNLYDYALQISHDTGGSVGLTSSNDWGTVRNDGGNTIAVTVAA